MPATVPLVWSSSIPPLPQALSPQPMMVPGQATAALLSDIEQKIRRLNNIKDIRGAIEQMENGEVHEIREALGPKAGRETDKRWGSIKNVVNRREKLYKVLEVDFRSNKDEFFAYFTKPSPSETTKKGKGSAETLYSFTQVVEKLFPSMEKAIREEMSKLLYVGKDGEFSEELWKEKWGDMHRFAIWDAIKAQLEVQSAEEDHNN